jgi:hypothetical protein
MELGLQARRAPGTALDIPQPAKAALPFAVIAAACPMLVLAGVAWPLAATAAAGAATYACVAALRALREREALRRAADELLVIGIAPTPHSPLLTWRIDELTSVRFRHSLGKSVKRIVSELEGHSLPSAVPLHRPGARPHLHLLRTLADRLLAIDRPVSPVGLVLVEDLLTDGYCSPLYVPHRAYALRPALEQCLAALEPVAPSRQHDRQAVEAH